MHVAERAGWYPDTNPYLVRYWDGSAWTERTAPRSFGPPEPLGQRPVGGQPHATVGTGRSPRSVRPARRRPGWLRQFVRVCTAAAALLLALLLAVGFTLNVGRYLIGDRLGSFGSDDSETPGTSAAAAPDGKDRPGPARRPFLTCAGAAKADAIPLTADHPRWNPDLDPDGDGRACDE